MGRFVQAISHDFRTSLATIETGRYVIGRWMDGLEQEGSDKIQQKLATIHHSVEHMTEQLQNLYRVTALADLKLMPCNVNEVVEAVLAKVYPRAEHKGQIITFEPDKTLLLIHADVNELRGAVEHLMANAINYTPENGHIMIRTARTGGQAVVEVRDNGIGIAAEQLPQIFDFFYRGDMARGLHSGGVGLGLSIVRLVAEAHGGTIQASSQPGAGSVFTLSLPLAKMPAHASATVA
jgi:two-component system sensor histidine kinase BaeS